MRHIQRFIDLVAAGLMASGTLPTSKVEVVSGDDPTQIRVKVTFNAGYRPMTQEQVRTLVSSSIEEAGL
jgi:hypothetical protein